MAEKLNVKQTGFYEIEVNETGDKIVFDTEDIELPFKFNEAFKKVDEIGKNLKRQAAIIDKREAKEDGWLTSRDYDYLKLTRKMYAEMRTAMDMFLGEGGCQKIFGARNYPNMYADLLEALLPHFERIGLSHESTAAKIAEKYGDKNADTLA